MCCLLILTSGIMVSLLCFTRRAAITSIVLLLAFRYHVKGQMLCMSCKEVVAPKYCEYVTTCGPSEVCYVDAYITSNGDIRYNSGCRDSRMCTSNFITPNDQSYDKIPVMFKREKKYSSRVNLSRDISQVNSFKVYPSKMTYDKHKSLTQNSSKSFRNNSRRNQSKLQVWSHSKTESSPANKSIHKTISGNQSITQTSTANTFKKSKISQNRVLTRRHSEDQYITPGDKSKSQRNPGDQIICSQCCHSPLCNQAGCGQGGFPANMGPLCYSCSQQRHSRDCSKIELCLRSEICSLIPKIIAADVVFVSGCVTETDCRSKSSAMAMSRRSLTATGDKCSICCNSTLCNNNCDPASNIHATIHPFMPPVPTLDPCLDLHPDCARISDCASVWAKLNCPGMCNADGCRRTYPTTTSTTPLPSKCIDYSTDCELYDRMVNGKMCLSNFSWSQNHCYKYCRFEGCS